MLLLFFCLFLLHFFNDLWINRCLDYYRNQYVFCLICSLCYIEMTEGSEKCDKMFKEVDNDEWNISDDNDDDLRSNSEKE